MNDFLLWFVQDFLKWKRPIRNKCYSYTIIDNGLRVTFISNRSLHLFSDYFFFRSMNAQDTQDMNYLIYNLKSTTHHPFLKECIFNYLQILQVILGINIGECENWFCCRVQIQHSAPHFSESALLTCCWSTNTNLCNAVFLKSQNLCNAGTLCINIFEFKEYFVLKCRYSTAHRTFLKVHF